MQLWQYCLLVTARSLYRFRMLSLSIIRSTKLHLLALYIMYTYDAWKLKHKILLMSVATGISIQPEEYTKALLAPFCSNPLCELTHLVFCSTLFGLSVSVYSIPYFPHSLEYHYLFMPALSRTQPEHITRLWCTWIFSRGSLLNLIVNAVLQVVVLKLRDDPLVSDITNLFCLCK